MSLSCQTFLDFQMPKITNTTDYDNYFNIFKKTQDRVTIDLIYFTTPILISIPCRSYNTASQSFKGYTSKTEFKSG